MPHKRGNPHRAPKRRRYRRPEQTEVCQFPAPLRSKPVAPARLTLWTRDPITGDFDQLSSLFYEYYRGYTIYSTPQGRCCIHGPGQGGCVQIEGRYACFPDIEDAKALIKWVRANPEIRRDGMNWHLPRKAYICLNRPYRACPSPERFERRRAS